MTISADIREGWLNELEEAEKWMALFSVDPSGLSVPATVEVSGDVYARQESLWTRTGATTLLLADGLKWRNLPPGSVVAAVGAFDDAFAGSYLFSDLVPGEPVSYPSGGTYVLPAGEYELRID